MGFLDAMSSFGGSISNMVGGAPKAMLFVRDFTGNKKKNLSKDASKSKDQDVKALRNLIKSRDKTAQEIAAGKQLANAGQVMDFPTGGKAADKQTLIQELKKSNYLAFEVQFNPNKISMTTRAGKIADYKALGDAGRHQLSTVTLTAATTLSVQLIFDEMNIQDAFVREGNLLTNPTIGNVVGTIQSIAVNRKGGYSVKKQTEGLISLLTFQQTREVIFTWCEMFFHGNVTDISAQYTMFNKIGNPIRSTVDLTIRQADTGQEFVSDKQYWDDAFTAAFGPAGMKMEAKTRSAMDKALGGWF